MGSIAATRRRLWISIAAATVLSWAVTIGVLARGGRPDPPALRAASVLLDGHWRFRPGDDPRWADPRTDDAGWETLELTAAPGSHDGDVGLPDYVGGWMAHGHPGLTGYAWYRRGVDVPAGHASWEILGPTLVEDGYELFWNGQLLGGSGSLGRKPRVVGTRPLRFALPDGAAGTQGLLAIRVLMLPRSDAGADGGGLHTPPILAPRPVSDGLHRAQWERTIAGYVVDAIEPLAMVSLVVLMLWCRPRSTQGSFLLLASVALMLMAGRRLNNALVAWTDLLDLPTYGWLANVLWVPTMAGWALAWNRWSGRPWRVVDLAAAMLTIVGLCGALLSWATASLGSRLGWIALACVLVARVVRSGPMRVLAGSVVALITLAFFGGELLDPLGVPGIWFPFGIGVSRTQFLYAVLVPLLALLTVGTLTSLEAPALGPSRRPSPPRPGRAGEP